MLPQNAFAFMDVIIHLSKKIVNHFFIFLLYRFLLVVFFGSFIMDMIINFSIAKDYLSEEY